MTKGHFIRLFICIAFLGFCLYSYLDLQNEITELRIRLPQLTAHLRQMDEENTQLLYEIEAFESPENLMQLAKRSEFSNLKFPTLQEVITLRESEPLVNGKEIPETQKKKPNITFASSSP